MTYTFWLFQLGALICEIFCLVSSGYYLSRFSNLMTWQARMDDHFGTDIFVVPVNYYDNGFFENATDNYDIEDKVKADEWLGEHYVNCGLQGYCIYGGTFWHHLYMNNSFVMLMIVVGLIIL